MPDHALQATDVARLALTALAVFVLPGAAWHLALWPPGADLGRLERLATLPFMSYLMAGALALALGRLGILTPAAYGLGLVALVALGLALSLRSARRRGWRGSWRPSLGPLVGGTVAVAVLAAFVIAPQVRIVLPDGYPIGTITWYYWGLADQIADSALLPRLSAEWGGLYPYQGDYVLFSAFSAGTELLSGRFSDMAMMELLRIGGLAWGVVAALGAFRRFVPAPGALLGTLLFFTSLHVFSKYTGYRPESFHYALIFSALWFTDRFAERMTIVRAVPIVATIVALWVGHGVVLVLAGLLAGAMVVARWFVDARPTPRVLAGFAGVLLAGFVASVVTDLLLQGSVLLFANAADPGRIQGAAASDLTWQFRQWALGGGQLLTGLPAEAERLITARVRDPWGVLGPWRKPLVLLLVPLPLLAWRWLPKPTRRLYAAGLVFLVGLFVSVAVFLTTYDTYVPQRVGFGRLAPFTLIGATLLLASLAASLAGVLGALGGWLARHRTADPTARPIAGRSGTRQGRALGWGAAAVFLAGLVAFPAVAAVGAAKFDENIRPEGWQALTWIRDHTDPDAVVLANSYTEGSIAAISKRLGLLDGRAPYNKEFDFLSESIRLLRASRSFYAGETSLSAIAAEGVDIVVVAPRAFQLANARPFCSPDAERDPRLPCFDHEMGTDPGLQEVARFGDIIIYRVIAGDASAIH